MTKATDSIDYAAIEWDKDGKRLGDDPAAMLDLPEGLLALEGLPVTFGGAVSYPVTQDKVLAAAQHIIDNRKPEQEEKRFHNQAEVMSFASREFGWLTGKEMGLAAIGNYMQLPKEDEQTKAAKAEGIDGIIEVLKSGMLTTREGTRKLFPDLDVDAIWDKHEARIAEAKEEQQRKAGKGQTKPDEPRWAEKVEATRKSKPNPCLGF